MKVSRKSLIVSCMFLVFVGFLFVAHTSFAEVTYTLLEPISVPGGGEVSNTADLNNYINLAVQVMLGIAGVLAVIMIMIGGIEYLSTDAVSGKSAGREKINAAIFGILLAIVSWIILNTINPDLLKINI